MKPEEEKRVYLPRAQLNIRKPFSSYLLFFLPKKPRPDFTKEPIEMMEFWWNDDFVGELSTEEPIFTIIDPLTALRNRWFNNVDEYQIIASFEFARRYPAHIYSKKFLKMYGYKKEQIKAYITGTKYLRVIHRKGWTRVIHED